MDTKKTALGGSGARQLRTASLCPGILGLPSPAGSGVSQLGRSPSRARQLRHSHPPKVKAWLTTHPRFHFHFTPTSCSWLNLIECWFSELTRKRLKRGAFGTVPELVEAISAFIRTHNSDPKPFVWTASVQSILRRAPPGWVLNFRGAAADPGLNEVYATSDGGVTWARIARTTFGRTTPVPDCVCIEGVSFRNRRIGWLTGSSFTTPGLVLDRTDNRGRFWFRQALPLPAGYTAMPDMATAPPRFFRNDGVLPAYLSSPPAFVIYTSSDGGRHWTPTTPIRIRGTRRSAPRYDAFAFGPNRIWAWVGKTLYGTRDAGRTWKVLARGLPLSRTPQLDFVRMNAGFALPAEPGRPYVLVTFDGGRSWRRVATELAT